MNPYDILQALGSAISGMWGYFADILQATGLGGMVVSVFIGCTLIRFLVLPLIGETAASYGQGRSRG